MSEGGRGLWEWDEEGESGADQVGTGEAWERNVGGLDVGSGEDLFDEGESGEKGDETKIGGGVDAEGMARLVLLVSSDGGRSSFSFGAGLSERGEDRSG